MFHAVVDGNEKAVGKDLIKIKRRETGLSRDAINKIALILRLENLCGTSCPEPHHAFGNFSEMPSEPAMMTAVVRPQKSPWSTTPTVALSSSAARTASLMGSLKK